LLLLQELEQLKSTQKLSRALAELEGHKNGLAQAVQEVRISLSRAQRLLQGLLEEQLQEQPNVLRTIKHLSDKLGERGDEEETGGLLELMCSSSHDSEISTLGISTKLQSIGDLLPGVPQLVTPQGVSAASGNTSGARECINRFKISRPVDASQVLGLVLDLVTCKASISVFPYIAASHSAPEEL